MRFGYGEAVVFFLQRDLGLGVHLGGGEAGLPQDQRKRHGEAARMGGADQLFRIGAGLAFETGGETIRIFFQRAAFGGNRTLAVLETALPFCRAICRHLLLLFKKGTITDNFNSCYAWTLTSP